MWVGFLFSRNIFNINYVFYSIVAMLPEKEKNNKLGNIWEFALDKHANKLKEWKEKGSEWKEKEKALKEKQRDKLNHECKTKI